MGNITPKERMQMLLDSDYSKNPLYAAIIAKDPEIIKLLVDGLSVDERLQIFSQLHSTERLGCFSNPSRNIQTTPLVETLYYQRQRLYATELFLRPYNNPNDLYAHNDLTLALFYGLSADEQNALLDALVKKNGLIYETLMADGTKQTNSVKTSTLLALNNFFNNAPFASYGEKLDLKELLLQGFKETHLYAVGTFDKSRELSGFAVALANGVPATLFTKKERLNFFNQNEKRPMVDAIKQFTCDTVSFADETNDGFQYVFEDSRLSLWFDGFSLEETQKALTDTETGAIIAEFPRSSSNNNASKARNWVVTTLTSKVQSENKNSSNSNNTISTASNTAFLSLAAFTPASANTDVTKNSSQQPQQSNFSTKCDL